MNKTVSYLLLTVSPLLDPSKCFHSVSIRMPTISLSVSFSRHGVLHPAITIKEVVGTAHLGTQESTVRIRSPILYRGTRRKYTATAIGFSVNRSTVYVFVFDLMRFAHSERDTFAFAVMISFAASKRQSTSVDFSALT